MDAITIKSMKVTNDIFRAPDFLCDCNAEYLLQIGAKEKKTLVYLNKTYNKSIGAIDAWEVGVVELLT